MKKALYSLAVSLFLIVVFYFAAPHFVAGQCRTANGKVSAVYGTARESIVLKLSGLKYQFQFGSQAFRAFTLQDLRKALVGQDVKILYHEKWTPLNPSAYKPIATLSVGEQILYSESE